MTPREVFEHYHERFLDTQQKLGISYDLFTHTDTENHHAHRAGDLPQLLEQRLSVPGDAEAALQRDARASFLPDRYVEGTCPICDYDKARGDQCDNCGNLLDAHAADQPAQPQSPGRHADRARERALLPRSAGAARADCWTTWQTRTALAQQRAGLQPQLCRATMEPRAVHPRPDWGIPVPLPDSEGKCIYVWFEAVMGYLTATVEWAQDHRPAGRLEGVVVDNPRRRRSTTSSARTTSCSTRCCGRACCWA